MNFSVNFIERHDPETGSIEAVFAQIGDEMRNRGISVNFQKLEFANNGLGMLRNLLFFRAEPGDLYHITGHVHFMGLRLPADRTVLTVHDLGILKNRMGIRRWLLKQLLFDLPVKRLGYITTVSENTKRELVKVTGCDESKIRVIANPIRTLFRPTSKPFHTDEPLILQIGTAPHKNLKNLIVALRGLKCRLKIIGKLEPEQLGMLRDHNINFENTFDLVENQIYDEYVNADIVAFCSTLEGFGLPIIEAQAVGRALLTSNILPMSAVAGPAAFLADPFDPKSIRAMIEEIISNTQKRESSIRAGFANIRRFDAELVASEYKALYKEMLSKLKTVN